MKYHLNHFVGGDFELNGKIVEFDSIKDAEKKVKEWDETDWSIHDENDEHVMNV